jgi:hypothetical protein
MISFIARLFESKSDRFINHLIEIVNILVNK